MTMRPTTGDKPEAIKTQAVQLTQIGVVLKSDLTVATAMVNVAGLSGKQLGSVIVAVDSLTTKANPALYMAAGPNPTDAWLLVGPAASGGGA